MSVYLKRGPSAKPRYEIVSEFREVIGGEGVVFSFGADNVSRVEIKLPMAILSPLFENAARGGGILDLTDERLVELATAQEQEPVGP